MNIAVIPARGGSKRIPRKNIKLFCGKPIIAWSIETAIATDVFSRIIVSTDDAEIAQVAKEYGAEAPFVRPEKLSDDFSGTTEVVAHATEWVMNQGVHVSAVCCIYATAPLMQAEDVVRAKEVLDAGAWEYVFSATEFDPHLFRTFVKRQEGGVEMIFPQYFHCRTQDLPIVLQDAAQFYWGKPSAWLNQKRIFEGHSTCMEIPRWRVQDIDTFEDWQKAETIFRQIKGHNDG